MSVQAVYSFGDYKTKPPYPAGFDVDWTNPLARGLVADWMPYQHGQFRNIANQARYIGTITGSNFNGAERTRSHVFHGVGLNADNGDTVNSTLSFYADAGYLTELNGATELTMFVAMGKTDTLSMALCYLREEAPYRVGFQWDTDGTLYSLVENGSGSFPSFPVSGAGAHIFALRWSTTRGKRANGKVDTFVDGVYTAPTANDTTSVTTALDATGLGANTGFGRDYGGSAYRYSTGTQIYSVRYYNKWLSDDAIACIARDYYGIYANDSLRYVARQAITIYTLTASGVVVPVTTQTMAPTFNRKMPAATTNVPMSMTAMAPKLNRSVAASSNSVPVAAIAANMLRNRLLGASTLNVPASAKTISPLFGRRISALSVNEPIAPTSSALLRRWALTAGASSTPIVGTAASFRVNRRVVASFIAVPVSPMVAAFTLIRIYRMTASGTTANISVSASVLDLHRRLGAAAVVVPLAPTDARLLRAFAVSALGSSSALSAQPVSLLRNRAVSALGTSVPMTADAMTMRAARLIAASTVSTPVVATAVLFNSGRILAASSVAVAVAAIAANLRANRTLGAGSDAWPIDASPIAMSLGRHLDASSVAVPTAALAASFHRAYALLAGSPSTPVLGTDAQLSFGRRLAAGLMALPLASSAITTRIGRGLTALSVAWPVGSSPATLAAGRRVVAEGSIVSLLASEAALLRAFTAELDSVEILLASQPASVILIPAPSNYALSADGFSLGLAAQAVNFLFTRKLRALSIQTDVHARNVTFLRFGVLVPAGPGSTAIVFPPIDAVPGGIFLATSDREIAANLTPDGRFVAIPNSDFTAEAGD